MYKVVETFHSIQSEGVNAGRGALFIRFYGCNLACDFGNGMVCDEPLHTEKHNIIEMSAFELVELSKGKGLVVITGGEPSLNNINPLIEAVQRGGCEVAVETNGYSYDNIKSADWITWSPKFMFDKKAPRMLGFNEIKLLAGVNNPINPKDWSGENLFVQPIADGDEPCPFNTTYCVDFVKKHPKWKLSLQMHKYIGVR